MYLYRYIRICGTNVFGPAHSNYVFAPKTETFDFALDKCIYIAAFQYVVHIYLHRNIPILGTKFAPEIGAVEFAVPTTVFVPAGLNLRYYEYISSCTLEFAG